MQSQPSHDSPGTTHPNPLAPDAAHAVGAHALGMAHAHGTADASAAVHTPSESAGSDGSRHVAANRPEVETLRHRPTKGGKHEVLEAELDQLANALAARFEELTVIHGLTQRLANSLALTEQSSQVARSLLDELAPCIASTTLAIHLFPGLDRIAASDRHPASREQGILLPVHHDDEIFEIVGESMSFQDLVEIVTSARAQAATRAGQQCGVALSNDLILNTGQRIRVAIVPIHRGNKTLGQMVAIRTIEQAEFGTVEADMMMSTSTMLAVHLLNQRQYQQMQGMFASMIQSLASALDAKDAYTCGHSNRVADISFELAMRLGYDDSSLANIRMGGILHDIGKIGVDDSVLRKPAKLTEIEFEQIKKHPVLGYDILKGIDQFGGILPAVRHHHESWDGSGYPDGLSGDNIPRDAQIVAVADAFDAMTSDRPYRPGMPIDRVVEVFRGGRGRQWAADVVDALLSIPGLNKANLVNEAGPDQADRDINCSS